MDLGHIKYDGLILTYLDIIILICIGNLTHIRRQENPNIVHLRLIPGRPKSAAWLIRVAWKYIVGCDHVDVCILLYYRTDRLDMHGLSVLFDVLGAL